MTLKSVEQFLRDLPRGMDSYPQCEQKGAVLRTFMAEKPLDAYVDQVPAEVARLVREPPPVSSWVPEVHATALYLAMMDLCFSGEQEFVDFAHATNRKLLDGPIYWAVFRLVGAERVVTGAASRWGQMHKGTTLTARMDGSRSSTLVLEFPVGLVPPVLARCYMTGMAAAVEVAGGKDVKMSLGSQAPTSITMVGSWT
ncbi:MAG: hypothetical protein AB2A00_01270 [Myxococcota bacterium]